MGSLLAHRSLREFAFFSYVFNQFAPSCRKDSFHGGKETLPRVTFATTTKEGYIIMNLSNTANSCHVPNFEGDDVLFTLLVSGCHVENAAKAAGISERTAFRRLADPAFRARLEHARESLRESILAKLSDAAHDAISVMTNLMHESEDDRVRLQSARALLNCLASFHASIPKTKVTATMTVMTEQES